MMIIYRAINLINYKCYIGQTIHTLNKRKNEHNNLKSNSYIHKSIKKYGKNNFKWEILCECKDINELNKMEEFCITFFDTMVPKGYNLVSGGKNYIVSEETRKKMSERKKKE